MSFEAFLWSITQQESGGNWHAVGPAVQGGHHAYGRYQVMDYNVGPWTARYYGKRLTPQQFQYNKAAQQAVVRGVLGGYYKRYGARGAAAMWYSGRPNPNATYGNPPVYRYVNSVVSRMSGYSGGGGGGGLGEYAAPIKVALSESELAERYGLTLKLINSSRSLKSLFKKAVAGQWSDSKFTASLRNTAWWRKQPSSLRKWVYQKYSDPATHRQKWKAGLYAVNAMAVEVGFANQLRHGKATGLLKDATYNMLALGWSKARIQDWLGARVRMHDGIMYGKAGETFDKLHELAYLNGMKYSSHWYADHTRDVAGGKSTLQRVEDQIRRAAGAKFYAYKNQIMAGQNVMDLAAPYIKSVANILELPETDVDVINNKHVIKAMTAKVGKGEQAATQYPLWKFENELRADPLWKKTNNARESMFTTAHQVLKDFGMAF